MVEKNWGEGTLDRDMEEKGIVLRELSCRTTTKLPPPDLPALAAVQLLEYTRRSSRVASTAVQLPEYTRRSSRWLRRQFSSRSTSPELPDCGISSAEVRELSSGSAIPFSSMSPPTDSRRSFVASSGGGNSAAVWQRKGLYSRSSAAAEFPPPELLVRWSTKS